MEQLSERIRELIRVRGKKKAEFARALNVSQAFVSQMCSGERMPSDRTIADICREFDVSEEWLRNGTGPMFVEKTRDEELADFFGHVPARDDFKQRLLSALSRLDESEWAMLEQVARKLLDELNG